MVFKFWHYSFLLEFNGKGDEKIFLIQRFKDTTIYYCYFFDLHISRFNKKKYGYK